MTSISRLRREVLESVIEKTQARAPPKKYKFEYNYTGKTPKMILLELKFGEYMEEMLSAEKLGEDIVEKLGVDKGTVSRWRKRLGIVPEYTEKRRRG